jgi:hypothetical protein
MTKGTGYGKKKAPAKKKQSPSAIAGPTKQEQDTWRAEDDARTLMRAEEIKRDSARIKAAQAQAKKQIEELARVVKK